MAVLGSPERPLRVAVVGSGPSGFFAVEGLLKQKELSARIDIFDRLPTPYGLVRGGVAPDHQNIKRIISTFQRTGERQEVRFLGNVKLGEHIQHAELKARYDAIIYAVGNESARDLGIEGENLAGVHSATEFVFWYNGHPDYRSCQFDLARARRVAVVGNGNVAMDISRILARDRDELAATDIADYALDALRASPLREVLILGRRGPAQAAFAPKEIQEIGKLKGADLVVHGADPDPASQAWLTEGRLPKTASQNVAYLQEVAAQGEGEQERKVHCFFLVSPAALLGEGGRLTGVRLVRNRLVESGDDLKAVATEETWTEPVDLVFKAIGYRGVAIPGVPFDERAGLIPNEEGRVLEGGQVRPGEYVVGWAKRGPTGLIGTNKPDAQATIDKLLEDLPSLPPAPVETDVRGLLAGRGARVVDFADWLRLDAEEVRRGQARGRVREKFCSIPEMLAFLDADR